jgi:hypothetical protein
MKLFLTYSLVTLTVSNVFAQSPSDIKRACDVLAKKIEKPTLPTQRISLGSIINPFIPPEVYTECTNTYDTGVPDLGNCHVEDGGSSRVCVWTPFGDACTDIPNAPRTVCSNIIACNTYKTHKRFNVCEVAFTLKVPNFISEPITKYIDSAYNTIEATRNEIRSALPLACVPDEMKNSVTPDFGQTLADAVTA